MRKPPGRGRSPADPPGVPASLARGTSLVARGDAQDETGPTDVLSRIAGMRLWAFCERPAVRWGVWRVCRVDEASRSVRFVLSRSSHWPGSTRKTGQSKLRYDVLSVNVEFSEDCFRPKGSPTRLEYVVDMLELSGRATQSPSA